VRLSSSAGPCGNLWGLLASVLGLFFGGWVLSCILEPLVGWLMRMAHIARSTAVFTTFVLVLVAFVVVCVVLGPVLSVQIDESIAQLPATLDSAGQRIVAVQRLQSTGSRRG
jgi:predicted PurR-regulated permease PerM